MYFLVSNRRIIYSFVFNVLNASVNGFPESVWLRHHKWRHLCPWVIRNEDITTVESSEMKTSLSLCRFDYVSVSWNKISRKQLCLSLAIYIIYMYNFAFALRTGILPSAVREAKLCTQRILREILLNQTEFRLYLPCTDWFGTENEHCPFGVKSIGKW